MSGTSKPNKAAIARLGVIAALALAALVSWASFHPRALEPVKTLTITATHGDGSVTSFDMETTARYLDEALAARDFLDILPTEDGPLLMGVDGEYADAQEGTYWVYTVNSSAAGVITEQPVADGDAFDFYLLNY